MERPADLDALETAFVREALAHYAAHVAARPETYSDDWCDCAERILNELSI